MFSPINRLHSTANEFMGKEPWKYRSAVERAATDALRLRRRLIPYLYAMNYRTHTQGRALIEPMYYEYPNEEAAYRAKNEYLFGSELIVCPVTKPSDRKTGLAPVNVWLPEGRFTDLFTGRIYRGGKELTLFRDPDSIPVFAREGAIVPLDCEDKANGCEIPKALEILIFRGNGTFDLYEDDGETMDDENGKCAVTEYTVRESGKDLAFTISPASGDHSVLPKKRQYKLSFRDVAACERLEIKVNGEDFPFEQSCENGTLCVFLDAVSPDDSVSVKLFAITEKKNEPKKEHRVALLSRLQGRNGKKALLYGGLVKDETKQPHGARLKKMFRELDEFY